MQLVRVRKTHIKQLVKKLLSDNPPATNSAVNVEQIARKLGIDVIRENASDDVAGFLIKNFNDKTAVIGVNTNHGANRQRFTIAHEIGHFFLHNYEGVHFDGRHSGSMMYLRDEKSSKGTDVEEKEANFFAAELLMPEHLLINDLKNIKEISLMEDQDVNLQTLAKKYKVSPQALTFRLANLGYLTL
jgi:Zn-dependent peptidase ImmA (M78 family)